ncbi:MAG TPA: AAA family ATPase, partial [Candidatus Merdenecus merdavium]|nr:AAA family ATPase [Candidatus Merdenecus merdavium]
EKTQGESEKIQIDYANLKQKVEFAQQNLERIQGECRKLEEEREGILSKAGIAQKEIKEKEFNISQIEETVKMAIKTMEKTSEEIEELTKEKERRSLQYKSFFNQREELSKRINQLDKECFKLNSQREKLEEISENQINYMWDEYELTLNSAIELKDDSYQDKTSLKKEILKTKEEIRTLGDVNVNAIEDYKNLSQRYEFLLAQHDDLVEAEKTLLHIIEELDSGMRIQFQEKFHQIQIEFDKVFKQLFGGGKGTLELEEEGDILEAGVKITSQPPGKKLQNMMQLSGGEKALTAIALLFAIQNLKPSPFCLLDEIEAALDDSNVSRYAQYLHKLTNHTQFIIITHRRGTMAAADRLYGITMQEKGVSTLVSVNLIEDELDK